jgi:hypothetical protein
VLRQISLREDAARDYDPVSSGGDGEEHREQTNWAIDNNRSTYWSTESYGGAVLQKDGVGLTVDVAPGAVVRQLRVHTRTPGFSAEVYVTDAAEVPDRLDSPAWRRVATVAHVDRSQRIDLATAGQRSRHVLLWITSLPPSGRVEIEELLLLE